MKPQVGSPQAPLRGNVLAVVLNLVLFFVSASSPWWKLYAFPEPRYYFVGRLIVCGVALVAAILSVLKWSWKPLAIAAAVATAMPIFCLYLMVLLDAKDCILSQLASLQADTVWTAFSRTFQTPQLSFMHPRSVMAPHSNLNNYTIVDALECGGNFIRLGFVLTSFLGLLGLYTALVLSKGAFGPWFRKNFGWAAATLLLLIVVPAIPAAASHFLLQSATQDLSFGRTVSAQRKLDLVEKYDPRYAYDIDFHSLRGEILAITGKKDNPEYWFFVARSYEMSGLDGHAIHTYEDKFHMVLTKPAYRIDASQLLARYGAQDYRSHRYDQAIARWNEALRLDPTNVETKFHLANALTTIGHYDEAITQWKSLIELNESVGMYNVKYVVDHIYRKPVTAESWNRLAWCYAQKGNWDAANLCKFNSTQQGKTNIKDLP